MAPPVRLSHPGRTGRRQAYPPRCGSSQASVHLEWAGDAFVDRHAPTPIFSRFAKDYGIARPNVDPSLILRGRQYRVHPPE
jgi:hypothetical protein